MSTRRSTSEVKGTLYLLGILLILAVGWMLVRGSVSEGDPARGSSASPAAGTAASAATSTPRTTPSGPRSTQNRTARPSATKNPARGSAHRSGLPTCDLASLPPQAADTVALIEIGGPFPHPRNDGVTFGNREGLLPQERRGYYREYTVDTPRASTRGARRIVTGGNPATDPPDWYYTADHYDSFCVLTGR